MIENNINTLLSELPEHNAYGERITVVAAIKLQSIENINRAIACGITQVGDNHVQEFKEKSPYLVGVEKHHFIGRLQTNKVKYLIGKIDLIHSVDRLSLAREISKRSVVNGLATNVLLQINAGNEESKGGFAFDEILTAYDEIKKLDGIKIKGIMAMLPFAETDDTLRALATKTRAVYDALKRNDPNFEFLSMGMSSDWKLCVECGSNMIRVGTTIFGARNYTKQPQTNA